MNRSDEISRRNLLRKTGEATGIGIGAVLSGCAEDNRSETEKRIDNYCGTVSEIREGESYGVPRDRANYKVILEDVKNDGSIDIKVIKKILDEEGQNQEGLDDKVIYDRDNIYQDDTEIIEQDFRIWYIDQTEEGVRLCNAYSSLDKEY